MLVDFGDIRKTWVFDKKNLHMPIARVRDIITDRQTLFVPGLWAHTPNGLRIIPTNEIVRWSRNKIIIDESSLVEADKYPKLDAVLDTEVPLLKSRVFDFQADQGICTSLIVETLLPRVMKIEVSKGYLWWKEKRMIPRNKIHRVDEKGILIGDGRIMNTEVENID